MSTKAKLVFDDRVPFYKNESFVEYPKVKIRDYSSYGGFSVKKIMLYVYFVIVTSGFLYLLV
jgi:hypothetical protein